MAGKPKGEWNSGNSGKREGTVSDVTHRPFWLEETTDKFKYILVITDAFIKFVWFSVIKSTDTQEVIEHLTYLFNIFDCRKRIISDRDSFYQIPLKTLLNIKKYKEMVSVASPWANGQVEIDS